MRILVTLVLVGGNFSFVGFAIILFAREYRRKRSTTSNRAVHVLPSASTLTTAPITITSPQAGRRNSTVLQAERLHAEHLEHERRLQRNTSQRMEKQRRRTQNRVKARAALRQSQALHKVEIFCDLDDATISALVGEMTYESWPIGTKLVEEGDLADSLFVIMKGNCGVFIKGVKVHVLSKFDVFGENALVNAIGEMDGVSDPSKLKEVRNATVVASSPRCTVMALTGNSLRRLLEQGVINKEVLVRSVDDIAAQRDRRTKATRVLKKAVAKRKSKMGGASKTPEVARKVEESRRLLPDSF